MWNKIEGFTGDNLLSLKATSEKLVQYDALVGKDGRVSLFLNRQQEDFESMYISDLDDHIKSLETLRDAAKAHFGDQWSKQS